MHALRWSLLLLGAVFLPVQAGVVQGVVLDHLSGRPLARALVQIQPVPQAGGYAIGAVPQVRTMRAGSSGQFSFYEPEGLYLLTATRDSYFPVSYGSRKPAGRPIPIKVLKDSSFFAELRMRRRGGVTGYVFDENGVPMAGIPVIAYRTRLPLRSAGTATSDDRGIYRVGGLEPGKYWMRSGSQKLADGSAWLPTFGLGGRETTQARINVVTIDGDTSFADINPEPGQLFSLSGLVACPAGVVGLLLASEAGQRQTDVVCGNKYKFEGLAPGAYEVSGVTKDGLMAGFVELFLDRDSESGTLQLSDSPSLGIDVTLGNTSRANFPVKVFGRRQNLSESAPELELRSPSMLVTPGYWEFRAEVPAGMYVESITTASSAAIGIRRAAKPAPPTDAFDGFVPAAPRPGGSGARVRVVVSDKAARITGRVTAEDAAIPGAPVFLLPLTVQASRSLGGTRQIVADSEGRYQFDSLPPGEYQLAATFDVNDIVEEINEVRTAARITVSRSEIAMKDLTLWRAP